MEDVISSTLIDQKNFSGILLIDNKDKSGPEQYNNLDEILIKRKSRETKVQSIT